MLKTACVITIFCTIFVLFSCSKPEKSTLTLKSNETILEPEKKMEWVYGKNYGKWTPETKDIETARNLLKDCFEKERYNTANRFGGRIPDDYNIQFVCAITEKGERIIWINSFCKNEESTFKDWKTKIFFVADGGNCFFNIKINVAKNTYYDLMVNGPA